MKRERRRFGIAVLSIWLLIGVMLIPALANQSGLRIPEQVTGDVAFEHVSYLAEGIGARVTGTLSELATQEYIIDQFEAMGYEVEIQPFSFERRGKTDGSENIIATKPGKLEQRQCIVLPPALRSGNRARRIRETAHSCDPIDSPLAHLRPLETIMVTGRCDTEHLFHCLMDR